MPAECMKILNDLKVTCEINADGKVVIGGSSTRTGYIYMAIAMLDMVRKQYGVSDDEIVKIVQTFFGSRKKA